MKMSVQHSICTDDFGQSVFRGHWTGALVWAADCVSYGAIIPQASARYYDSESGKYIRRASYRDFADSERNCNTCKHLRRIPHRKDHSDFLEGECASPAKRLDAHPYADRFPAYGHMIFHPDDWMGMPCYESRWSAVIDSAPES